MLNIGNSNYFHKIYNMDNLEIAALSVRFCKQRTFNCLHIFKKAN